MRSLIVALSLVVIFSAALAEAGPIRFAGKLAAKAGKQVAHVTVAVAKAAKKLY